MPAFVYCTAVRRVDRRAAHPPAQLLGQRRRGRLLDQLLVAALDRALALAEVDDVALAVAQHLELDVARAPRRTSRCRRRGRRRPPAASRCAVWKACGSSAACAHDAHAAPAAAGRRLDDHRVADLLGDLQRLLLVLDRAGEPGITGTPAFIMAGAPGLVAHQPDHLGTGADELDVAGLADLGEVGALGEEAVAGVDRVGAGDLGRADDRRDVQVAVGAARRADADVLVGEAHVQAVARRPRSRRRPS